MPSDSARSAGWTLATRAPRTASSRSSSSPNPNPSPNLRSLPWRFPTTLEYGDLVVLVENDDGPGTYTARMCGMTQKGLDMTAQTSTAKVPRLRRSDRARLDHRRHLDARRQADHERRLRRRGLQLLEQVVRQRPEEERPHPRSWRRLSRRPGPADRRSARPPRSTRTPTCSSGPVTFDNAGAWPWTDGDPA
jgi:hypothetical protein